MSIDNIDVYWLLINFQARSIILYYIITSRVTAMTFDICFIHLKIVKINNSMKKLFFECKYDNFKNLLNFLNVIFLI